MTTFISFMKSHRYGCLNVFKNFKIEVENQRNKKIKSVRSNYGGKYYGKYDNLGEQCPRSFAKFLKVCSIISQYTMPSPPTINSVVERRNITLKDMVRSMFSHLPYQNYFKAKYLRLQLIS